MMINNSPTKVKRNNKELFEICQYCDKNNLKYYIDNEIVIIKMRNENEWTKEKHLLFQDQFNLILIEVDALKMKTTNDYKIHYDFRYAYKHENEKINNIYELEYPL